ncbi:cadmium-translocating P-type ATPase [Clostridium polyendosporum]|uniref:Cadmium-translocating P-type ATPase n=1 Tax=Clostridium polyendosporum TaxID=69208 RepID=A0A919S0N7_9CLOT|nr:heavy metal translocating P-type ATPase [Clostridium polyendosporum]GIM29254.1 cadmium-translocating P-type ATPase [Clostridium polyendosporum]
MNGKIKRGKIRSKDIKSIAKDTKNISFKVKKRLLLDGLCCANCAAKIEDKVSKLNGVASASVNFVSKTLTMEIEEEDKVSELIAATKQIVTNIEPDVTVKEKEVAKSNKFVLLLDGLCCANCAAKIERETQSLPEVMSAIVDFVSKRLIIELQDAKNKVSVTEDVKKIVKRIEPHVNVIVESSNRNSSVNNKEDEKDDNKKELIKLGIGGAIFAVATIFNFSFDLELLLYLISYVLVGGEVVLRALKNIARGQVFDENFLMGIATIGAFAIGEFPEGVAVMLFYQVGELFQDIAVNRSRKSIAALMDIRPDYANLLVNGVEQKVWPEDVNIGDVILVKPGEKVPLDGMVIEGNSVLDTSALTGESIPREVATGDEVLSGTINKNGVLTIKVTKDFGESTVAKILDLVQNASSKKAPTENFITKFARYYTPVVVFSALALALLPPLLIPGATFSQWIYRALVFLVVSCPCALVVSIPLGFFGGIGGASKNGVLVKGGNYLEALNNVEVVVFDKTGTLTKGIFKVTDVKPVYGVSKDELLEYAASAESHSSHPIATSIIREYGKDINRNSIENYNEVSGHGIKVKINGVKVLVGNEKLMSSERISFTSPETAGTVVHVALDGKYAGYIIISDEIKEDSAKAIKELKEIGVKKTVMLTGDSAFVGEKVGKELGIDKIFAELLPHEKVEKIEEINAQKSSRGKLVFVGDGINDAPVLARADVGIAMGGVGSDAAIEAADVVIMTDEPSKIVTAIKVAKKTKSIVIQNIVFAFGVKLIIMILGAFGVATMWEAVFGDVGVAIIAVLNAMRAMRID